MNSPPDIAIVIPTLNEGESLRSTLETTRSDSISVERIIVDGGSVDSTQSIGRESGCRVIAAERAHRAHQMNLGAAAATSGILLFLHADTRLPGEGIAEILTALEDPEIRGGGFVRVFESDSTTLKITGRLAAWRSRRLGLFLGDQGIFVRRAVFETLGGFDEARSLAEDLDFSRRLKQAGPVTALEGPAISSARRFEKKGPLRQSLTDFWLGTRCLLEK